MTNRGNLTALILAGGLGTRLRSVVKQQPKVLAEVAGRPFLRYLLDQLADWQIRNVVLCSGYLGDQIEACFGKHYGGLELRYSREDKPLGTAGALRLALSLIQSDTALVLNGDSYCAAEFEEFSRMHQHRGAKATILLVNNPDRQRFGSVQIAENGNIVKFAEKDEHARSGLINAGVYLIERRFLETIPESEFVSLEREIFPEWIGPDFYGFETPGPFLDIGTPESYAAAEAFFANIGGTRQ
ncbi:MAG: nucleotidyltransferase family protein [Gammaproteobacteria bacterium]